jgi:hypothetical protein
MANNKLIIAILILIVLPLASAFGVTTSYWSGNPLVLYPGETRVIDVQLQNMVGNEDMSLQAEISEGSEIATLIDSSTTYFVQFGKKDVKININVTIPQNATIGQSYNIKIALKQIAEEEGKMVQMTASVGATIPVQIVAEVPAAPEQIPPTQPKGFPILPVTLVLIVLIAIIAALFFRKRSKK